MTENSAPLSVAAHPRVAIVGGGVMGGTLAAALVAAGWEGARVAVGELDEAKCAALRADPGVAATTDVAASVADARVVILAVKPQVMGETLTQLAPVLPADALVVTVAAGLPSAFYEERLAPGTRLIRTMPNTPVVTGRGATAVAAGTHASAADVDFVVQMLAGTGVVVVVDEQQIDAVIAVSGSGPAYFFAFVEALTEAGVAQGLDRETSTALAAQTLVGAAELLATSGETPKTLRERVSSPGGTTLAALAAMDHAGLQGVVSAGAAAAARRSKELATELG